MAVKVPIVIVCDTCDNERNAQANVEERTELSESGSIGFNEFYIEVPMYIDGWEIHKTKAKCRDCVKKERGF